MRSRLRPVAYRGACLLTGGAAYAMIGFSRATAIGGDYPWPSMLGDFVGAAALLLVLYAIGLGISFGLQRLIPQWVRGKALLIAAAMGAYLLIGVLPFVLTVSQLCPQRVACRRTPADVGIPNYEDVRLTSNGLTIAGWYLPGEVGQRPLLLVHGIGANKDNFLGPAVELNQLGHPVLTIDLRAHGDSDGRICSAGYHEADDVQAGLSWLAERHPGEKLGAVAYSMGASATLRAAAEFGAVDRLIVDSTFARLDTVATQTVLNGFGPLRGAAWKIGRFWGWVLSGVDFSRHNPEESLRRANVSAVLIIHGGRDAMIPVSEAERLRVAGGVKAQLWVVRAAGHVETTLDPRYAERVHQFLK